MVFLDKHGWPVVRIKNRPIVNLLRLMLHTRKVRRGYWDGYRVLPYGETMAPPTVENSQRGPEDK